MNLGVLLLTVALFVQDAGQEPPYREYGTHDVAAVLGTKLGEDGKEHHYFDMAVADTITSDLLAHGRNFPPEFRSPEERARAERDVQRLAGALDAVTKRAPDQPDTAPAALLLLVARLHAVAYNLDVPGSAEKAHAAFGRLLEREPEHALANYHYGVFLAGIPARQAEARPRLEKALALGVADARYALAMLLVSQGEQAAALGHFEAWLALHPDDQFARHAVEAIKAGNVERVTSGAADDTAK